MRKVLLFGPSVGKIRRLLSLLKDYKIEII